MDATQMAQLLCPFVPQAPPPELLQALTSYLDLLLRWNRRLNLTAVRDEQNIVIRHFGESLFAAAQWFPADAPRRNPTPAVADIGSGAGFPGIPLKLYAPSIRLTLIEAHGKKATFLREVVRALRLRDVTVQNTRAEALIPDGQSPVAHMPAELVTLRAVEQFDSVLPVAARLVASGGRLGLLIGSSQVALAQQRLPGWTWDPAVSIPLSSSRVVLTGSRLA
jgi:16S rRNA (guanine527-N7)-methyltransferase